MKKFIKFLPIIMCCNAAILSLAVLLIPNKALADMVLYPSPDPPPVHLFGLTGLPLALGINFIVNLLLLSCFCYFYLNYKKITFIIGGTFIVTWAGLVIDFISFWAALIVLMLSNSLFQPIPHTRNGLLVILGLILFFLISFILLWLMYRLILKRLFGLKDRKKIMISSVALAILTNPVWLGFASFISYLT